MEDLPYNAVIPSLFRAVPEAKDAYDAWDMPGDPLPSVVFSFLEESFLTPAVNAGDSPELLKRIFGWASSTLTSLAKILFPFLSATYASVLAFFSCVLVLP
jgi:hypothetical protein